MIRKTFLAGIALLAFVNFAGAQVMSSRVPTDEAITEHALRAHVRFLADDLLEGRAPGSRGGALATRYIAAQFERIGLKPAGTEGTYFQPVRLFATKANQGSVLSVQANERAETFRFGDEFVAFTGKQVAAEGKDAGAYSVPVKSELVFVGYGVNAPEQRWNDYKGAPEEYKDKILVMLVNDPPATAAEPDLFGGRALTYYGRWTYKLEEAARRGARGVILLHTDASAGYGWNVVRTSWGGQRFDIARAANDASPYLDLRAWMTDAAAKKMFTLAGLNLDGLRQQAASRDFRPVKLNLEASLDLQTEYEISASPNVIAMIEGSDAQLKNQYVVYTAHWDHLGVGEPNAAGDRIYNGAVDNASGVASVLTIAEAFARLPRAERPARSILFVVTTAEEQGLLGAAWFVQHPTVPLNSIAANLNLDGLSFLGRTSDFVPLGAERSTLSELVGTVARERGLRVIADTRPEQGSFFRSDHFPLAKAGVPAISLRGGTEFVGRPSGWGEEQFKIYNARDYHQPSDELRPTADFGGVVQQTEFAYALGRRIADLKEMPRYNPNDEFARARQANAKPK